MRRGRPHDASGELRYLRERTGSTAISGMKTARLKRTHKRRGGLRSRRACRWTSKNSCWRNLWWLGLAYS